MKTDTVQIKNSPYGAKLIDLIRAGNVKEGLEPESVEELAARYFHLNQAAKAIEAAKDALKPALNEEGIEIVLLPYAFELVSQAGRSSSAFDYKGFATKLFSEGRAEELYAVSSVTKKALEALPDGAALASTFFAPGPTGDRIVVCRELSAKKLRELAPIYSSKGVAVNLSSVKSGESPVSVAAEALSE